MEKAKNQTCIDACQTCADACETCSTKNKGVAGMEHSVKLCIASAKACHELIAASKTNVSLDAHYKKCEDACNASGAECAQHTDMKVCEDCAATCNKCADECKAMLAVSA